MMEFEVPNERDFKKSLLTKPSNLCSIQAASNLKSVMKGELICIFILYFDKLFKDENYCLLPGDDDGSKNSDVFLLDEKEKRIDYPEPQEICLPPIHSDIPKQKPNLDQVSDLDIPKVLKLLLSKSSSLANPIFKFDVTPEAANENWKLLKENDFNWDLLLNPKGICCATSYGSEFKDVEDLELLLGKHPRWNALKYNLLNGVTFPLVELDDSMRRLDLDSAFERGNHKSALKEEDHLANSLLKETRKGWNIVFPEEVGKDLPGLSLNPMGVANHLGVSEEGTFIKKLRITHDLSFPGAHSEQSVNSRVISENLEPIMFGHCLLRVIHYIVSLRAKFPNSKIFIRKEDLKSAYRRMHLNPSSGVKSAVRVKFPDGKWYILIPARLPFGGSPCPNEFCLFSDIVADTINDLLAVKNWDYKNIRSDYTDKVPAPISLPDDIPFGDAKELSITLPNEDWGKCDVYIDDIISVAVDIGDNVDRLRTAPCSVIHAIADNCQDSILPRDNMIADDKNLAEGAPEEAKICLGWLINTRSLKISLPSHKFKAWVSQIELALQSKSIGKKNLESILGRIENVAQIIPMLGHFTNNLRYLQTKIKSKFHNVPFSNRAKEDLKLFLHFLKMAESGVSLNTLTFRKPDVFYVSDASEHGLGGFASHGRAWRFEIPAKLRGRAHINLLEFLTQLINIWIDILEKNMSKQSCLLCIGDSTSAMGWL